VSVLDQSTLRTAYLQACSLDVQALKPGNVSHFAPGYGMTAQDFLDSATHSVPYLVDEGLHLGDRIELAVAASLAEVGTNTNLGIVLLSAPLLMGAQKFPQLGLDQAVTKVLAATDAADTAAVYSAIRMANPGGMGEVKEYDLGDTPSVGLREVMSTAVERDMIALQYSNGYQQIFTQLLPSYELSRDRGLSAADAASELFLWLLSTYPDSHIQRNHSVAAASEASAIAGDCLAACQRARDAHAVRAHLLKLDRAFKDKGYNPGTSADLCVATFLSSHLRQQTGFLAGTNPDLSRESKPRSARMSQFSISQLFEGDMQWL